MLVQRLRELQNEHGFLPDADLVALAKETGVPLYRLEELVSFFHAFRPERDKPARLEVRICRDMTCHHRGAAKFLKLGEQLAGELDGVRVEGISCVGRCDRGPVAWVERHPMGHDDHAWVYQLDDEKRFRELVEHLADGGDRPPPDRDADYRPHTNPDPRIDPYAALPPIARRGETGEAWQPGAGDGSSDLETLRLRGGRTNLPPDAPQPTAARTSFAEVVRADPPKPYAAVRKFVAFLKTVGGLPPAPSGLQGKALDEYVQKAHPLLWELKVSTLAGMGGAGALAYTKRLDVWQQAGPDKYIVANGDESEPGTFKDREIMLRLPHLVVEGVILAGLMTGATGGFVFIRHEYHEQIAAVRAEIKRAVEAGACGTDIFASGIDFPVEVFESPGGYICGEQSALLEAMEDRRAQPRNRPPDLGSNGLRDRPTIVNNVETLAWTPHVVLNGGKRYADGGWTDGKVKFFGRRIFSVSGDVKRPGVFEVPIGLPLRELLFDAKYCGGTTGKLRALATSGPSGGFLPAKWPLKDFHAGFEKYLARKKEGKRPTDTSLAEWFVAKHLPPGATELNLLDVPLDLGFFGLMKELFGLPFAPLLGAGIGVYGGTLDALDLATNFTEFFRNESCGKCVPCRIGSQKLVQIGTGLLANRGVAADELKATRDDIAALLTALQQTSICSLGASAPMPLATALAYFQEKP
jgi:NADH:ubiquinone oxidoreductase subunit F (NADH-binding)/NADH:ubiquinone oxidoreductase subunit E